MATEIVWLAVLPMRKVQESEVLWPALRSKELEAEPLVMLSPELGVTFAVTVALEPPVLENDSERDVEEPLASVDIVGVERAVTVMKPGPLTVRVAFEVCVVTLV